MKKIIQNLAVAAASVLCAFTAISCSGLYGAPENTSVSTDNLYTLWTGSVASDDSSWPSNLVDGVKEAINTNGYARAEITLVVEPTTAGKSAGYYQYCAVESDQTKLTGASDASNNSGWELASAAESWTFMPTASDWSYITTTGLYISGCNYNLVGVYLSKVVPDYDSDVTTTFPYTNSSGFATGSEGSGHIIFANSTMKPLKTTFDAGTPVKLGITYTLDSSLSATSGTLTLKTNPTYGETAVTVVSKSVTAAGTYTLTLDDESATLFATYGMIVSGTNIRITKIYYTETQTVYISKIIIENLPSGVTSAVVKDAANSYAEFTGTTTISGTTATITASTTDGYVAYTTTTDSSGTQLYPELSDGTNTYYPYVGGSTTLNNSLEANSYKINVLPANTGTTEEVLTIVISTSATTSDAPITSVSLAAAN